MTGNAKQKHSKSCHFSVHGKHAIILVRNMENASIYQSFCSEIISSLIRLIWRYADFTWPRVFNSCAASLFSQCPLALHADAVHGLSQSLGLSCFRSKRVMSPNKHVCIKSCEIILSLNQMLVLPIALKPHGRLASARPSFHFGLQERHDLFQIILQIH